MCNAVDRIHSRCFWVGLTISPEATMVLLQNNLAYGKNSYDVIHPEFANALVLKTCFL
jgi:hypothetical protein